MKTFSSLIAFLHARLAAITLFLLAVTLPSCERSYKISRYDATIHMDDDGSARVTENISFAFTGEYHGIYRSIPVDYPGPNGSNYSLFVQPVKVTDEAGNRLKWEKSRSG